ncbi:unnamed protein product [Nippostrongylus brasiliensis]|uniref:Ras family protein n=1 Tax=Nippostrongylus brasiliensis TaxID=27835 RepID=A0A0N4Y1L5_NIPBR|nr:unnamed protein product [Nippostrongylus brasiliensis]
METDCHKISIVAHEPQFANNRFKILVVGRRECGKSALIRRLQRNTFENSKDIPEVVVVIRAVHGSIVKVDLVAVDICKFLGDDPITDQARVDFVKHSFDMSGLFLLYDTTNAETFAEIDEVLRVLKRMVWFRHARFLQESLDFIVIDVPENTNVQRGNIMQFNILLKQATEQLEVGLCSLSLEHGKTVQR